MSIRGVPFQFRVGPSDGPPLRHVPAAFLGGAQPQPLDLSADELAACSESLKKVRVRLHMPVGLLLRGLSVTVLVNPKVRWVAPPLATALDKLPLLAARAGVVPAQLQLRVAKLIGLSPLEQTVERGQRRLGRSRLLTARVLRKLGVTIAEAARQLLSVPDLKPELRARLESALAPIDSAQEKERAQALKRRDATKAKTEETQAELARLRSLEVLQQVLADVDEGRPVDPVLAAQALRTQRELEKDKEASAVKEALAAVEATKAKDAEGKAKDPKGNRRTPGR